jgi:hypothetical protein
MKFLLGYLLAMVVGAGGGAWIVLSTVHAQTSMPTPWAFIPAPIETSYLPPTTFMAVRLKYPPAMASAPPYATSIVTQYPVKVYLNGLLLPSTSWRLDGQALLVVLDAKPPLDVISVPGQAPAVRIDVEYWYSEGVAGPTIARLYDRGEALHNRNLTATSAQINATLTEHPGIRKMVVARAAICCCSEWKLPYITCSPKSI